MGNMQFWGWGTVTSVEPLQVNTKTGITDGHGRYHPCFIFDEVRSEAQVRQRRPPCARCLCVAPCRALLLTCATPVQANAAGDKILREELSVAASAIPAGG